MMIFSISFGIPRVCLHDYSSTDRCQYFLVFYQGGKFRGALSVAQFYQLNPFQIPFAGLTALFYLASSPGRLTQAKLA
jgi:hypothetical protein